MQVYTLHLSVILNVDSFDEGSSEVLPKYRMMGEKNHRSTFLNINLSHKLLCFFVFFYLNGRILIHNVAIPHGGAKVITDPCVFSDFERHH